MAIEGSLESVDLQDIVQLLNLNQSTGLLHINGASLAGVLYYQDGNVINAEAEEFQGEAAAYMLLTQTKGGFHFEVSEHRLNRVIFRPTQDLVLESARRKDTLEKIRSSIKHDNVVFLPLIDVRIPKLREGFNDFELALLKQLDGQTEIKNIIKRQKEGAFEVFHVIYDLEKRGHLKRVDIYKVLNVKEFRKLFGRTKDVYVSKQTADEWISQSMTYANCQVLEIHTQKKTFGQVGMAVKNNVAPGVLAMPTEIMEQFEVEPGDKVLVKPILFPS